MAVKSWLDIGSGSHFSLANIPFGIITTSRSQIPCPAIAIGDSVINLHIFASEGGFAHLPSIRPHLSVFSQSTLNAFAALGRLIHRDVRRYLQNILADDTDYPKILRNSASMRQHALFKREDVAMHLPMQIGDYTDFYAGRHHAYKVGALFRGPANALQPNYLHIPVGYHGRASSVVCSGTPIRRPCGQILDDPTAEPKAPIFAPCRKLDFELELGAFICKGNTMGERIRVNDAEEYLFGFVLLNDWSARDIQAWEYVPLGPFNSKNFATTISPWVVLADALEPYKCKGLENETDLLPYLRERKENNAYNINLRVELKTPGGKRTDITQTSSRNLLFSFPQMLAHHTSTGCPMRVGDLLGSGTISGMKPDACGSMLEQCANGKTTIKLHGGEERTFLEDGDEVMIRGWAGGEEGSWVGFGNCIGRINPAKMPDWDSL